MYKAIIFDLDGTIVDTERVYRKIWPKVFKHFGLKLSKQHNYDLRSLGQPYLGIALKEWYGKDIDFKPFNEYGNELGKKYFTKHPLKVKKGIKEAVIWLKANNYRLAIASASLKENVIERLQTIGLYQYFDSIISANDVKIGKPNGDTYRYVCKQLNLDPQDCLAIEDSPNGVKSALDAKLNVVMIPDLIKRGKEVNELSVDKLKSAKHLIEYIKNK